MSRNVVWILSCGVLAGLGFYMARGWTTVTLAQTSVQAVPFVFQTETYNFETDPKGKLIYKQTVARRSDGSEAVVGTVGKVEWGTTTKRVTLMNGTMANVYDFIAAKTTWHVKPSHVAMLKERLKNPPKACVFITAGNPVFIGNETILGHEMAIVQSETDGERGTFWRARDLACEELQFKYEKLQADGSYKVTSEEKLLSLNIGEPDPSFLEFGSNFVEMKPSDAHGRFFQKLGIPEDEATKRVSQQLDAKYASDDH